MDGEATAVAGDGNGSSPGPAADGLPAPRQKRFRPRSNYFVEKDLVWVRPAKLPYWPAEVLASDERYNRVRARLILPPRPGLLEANLKEEARVWSQAVRRQSAEQAKRVKREGCAGSDVADAPSTSSAAEDESAQPTDIVVPALEADVVTSSGNNVYFFDKLATTEELDECIEFRLKRKSHDVSAYEADLIKAVVHANRLVRTVLSPEKLKPYLVCGVGVVHSLMRSHIAAPRQPHTGTFEPQTAVIRLRSGLENAARDLSGFEYVWILFQFSYAAVFATGEGQEYVKQLQEQPGDKADASPAGESAHPWANRQGILNSQGFKTLIVPPRDEELRGVFATRSPHRPNFIGLSCVRLIRVQGLDIHIADHDLLHGTPVLDIKPYLPFCDAHPTARAGWVEELDSSGRGKGDHKVATQVAQVDRIFDQPAQTR